jgi:hypothetical protein
MELPYKFEPRLYQKKKFKAFFQDNIKHHLWVVHRRGGKDKCALNIMVAAALKKVGVYLYLFPESKQARKVIWRGLDDEGMPFLDHVPKELIDGKPNSTEMFVKLKNGSIIQLAGSNNVGSLLGMGACGIVYSEFQRHNPLVLQYLSPMIVQTNGWEIIQGTPLGKNHFFKLYQNVVSSPKWYTTVLGIDKTKKNDGSPVVTEEQVEDERKKGISEEGIRQEYYCDWNVGVQGAYFTKEFDDIERENRICNFDINPNLPVFTSWDIGVSDPTCIWFFQLNGEYIDFIYYIEKTDQGIEYYARELNRVRQELGINYQYHFAPHDIQQRKWGYSARSSLSLAREAGIIFQVVPDVGIDNGIQAMRAILPKCRFHIHNCALGIDSLREYRREWDDENRTFKPKPLHNWASHGADAFRYFAVYWSENMARPDMNKPRKYQSSFHEMYN